MNYKGNLVIREIPYPKRKIKWSYDVVEDKNGIFPKGKVLPSRVVLRHIIKGGIVEVVDEDSKSICLLGRI